MTVVFLERSVTVVLFEQIKRRALFYCTVVFSANKIHIA